MNADHQPAPDPATTDGPAALTALIELLGDQAAGEVVDAIVDEAPGLMATCMQALATHDAKRLSQQAHTLKSTSALLGARQLSQTCAGLEQRAAQSTEPRLMDELRPAVEQMLQQHAQLLEQLQRWRASHR